MVQLPDHVREVDQVRVDDNAVAVVPVSIASVDVDRELLVSVPNVEVDN